VIDSLTFEALESTAMTNLTGGLISGLIFGLVTVGLMLPMQFPDKTTALLAAFISRFGIGLVIGCVQLPWPGWIIGIVFGLLLSVPSAMITKAYAPIIIVGAVGGLVIGGILHGWK
jgi:small basic protein